MDDWDAASSNDWLGTMGRTYDITSLWGTLDGSPLGVYVGVPSDEKGSDATSINTIGYDYSITAAAPVDAQKNFRAQSWWHFPNFDTPSLSLLQYTQTFSDVDVDGDWWEKLWNPWDCLFYESIYAGCASQGNCFGMCLEEAMPRPQVRSSASLCHNMARGHKHPTFR